MTTADLQTYLHTNLPGVDLSLKQADILRRGMEKAVKRYCKWPIEANNGYGQGNFTEFYDGSNFRDIVLRQPWVAGVVNVWVDNGGNYGGGNNAFASTTRLTNGSDYSLVLEEASKCKSGLLRRLSNPTVNFPSDFFWPRDPGGLSYRKGVVWSPGFGNVKVTYDWGFQPQDQPSSVISSISWAANVATVTMGSAVVLRPGDEVTITSDANWAGDYYVATVAANNLSFTINTVAPSGGTGFVSGNIDCIPQDIKAAVAESVGLMRSKIRTGGLTASETLGDYSISTQFLKEGDFGSVRQLLSPWRDFSAKMAF